MLHLIIISLTLFSSDFDTLSNTCPSPTDSSTLETQFFPTRDSTILSHINSSKYNAEQNYMNRVNIHADLLHSYFYFIFPCLTVSIF